MLLAALFQLHTSGEFSNTKHYLYGLACLGEQVDADEPETEEWRYYQRDANPSTGSGLVRQTSDADREVTMAWTYSPTGGVVLGVGDPVTNLDCGAGGIYDWSTGLIFKNGRYFDPRTGIWITMGAIVTWQIWPKENRRQRRWRKRYGQQAGFLIFLLLLILMATTLSGCACAPIPTPGTPTVPPTLPPPTSPPPTNTPPPTSPPPTSPPPTVPPTTPPTVPPPTVPPPTVPPPTVPPTTPPWLEGSFLITHYHIVLESDPLFADDPRISIQGFPDERTFKQGFIWHPRAMLDKGTGRAEDGTYITIDWVKSTYDRTNPENNDWWFTEGIGANVEAWKTVATVDPRLPKGTKIIIESYQEKGVFLVTDTGDGLVPGQIDVFVGEMTIADVDKLEVRYSRVGIVK